MKSTVRFCAVAYLIALVALWGCVVLHNGQLWPVTLFLLSPRWVVALPLVALVPLTLLFQPRLAVVYVLHGAIILFCLLGYRVAWPENTNVAHTVDLRILTCNLGGGSVDTRQLVALVKSHNVDVMMLQECPWDVSLPVFQELGWSHRQEDNIAIGSSFELGEIQVLARHSPEHYRAVVAVSCEARLSDSAQSDESGPDHQAQPRTARLVSVHFPTFRPALEEGLRFNLEAGQAVRETATLYTQLAEQVRQQVNRPAQPTVIAGDFNVPVESVYYRDYWTDYQNAFSKSGQGFGYTKFTRYHGVRIDHVLADHHWKVESATVGPDFGGDHRPVLVELEWDE